jgi:hypothetical protein
MKDDGTWGVRIEDLMYGSHVNGTSLDDAYSDLAVIDTMFPGILPPDRVWKNFKETIVKNISKAANVTLDCDGLENINDETYRGCTAPTSCKNILSSISDIYLYFNATKRKDQRNPDYTQYILAISKYDYTVEVNGWCSFLFFTSIGSLNKRYLLGNAFLNNYYVMLNNTDTDYPTIGFNGDYWEVVYN